MNSDQNSQLSRDERGNAQNNDSGSVQGGAADRDASQADLPERLAKAEEEVASLKDAYLRAKAEMDNVRKQGQNDVARASRYAIERFAQDLLDVKDALEAGLGVGVAAAEVESMRAGVEMTLKNLKSAFDRAQITEINPAGEKYDPHRHQAMTMVESTQPANTIVEVFQKGYLLNDRVLRPALVSVAKAAGSGEESNGDA